MDRALLPEDPFLGDSSFIKDPDKMGIVYREK
jgi:hypothetical protein